MKKELFVVLDNVRSAHNVGSIFRTCDAAGVGKIFLCGVTPAPVDRFGRNRNDIAKVALGAEKSVAWEQFADTLACIEKLKAEGVAIVGVEQDVRAIDYRAHEMHGPTAFVFGNEVGGLSAEVRVVCDTLIEIPMKGEKESLNVAVAAGVVLFNTPHNQPPAPRRQGA